MPRSLDHTAFEAIHVTCKRSASRISVGSKERSMSHSRSKGTALITGASAGIGAVYADRLAKRDYDLVLVARNEARLKALSGRLTSETGRSVTPLRADLSDKADLATVESMLRDDQAITMLVNNAGIAAITPLLNTDVADVADMIALNIVALTRLTYAAAPAFVARRAGTIINIASVVGLSPETLNGVYGATKAYVIALSHALQHELAEKGVRIQVVLPAATATEIWEKAGLPYQNLPASIVMSAEDMVDAALVGLDQGEVVTLPSLHDGDQWTRFEAARRAIAKQFGNSRPRPDTGSVYAHRLERTHRAHGEERTKCLSPKSMSSKDATTRLVSAGYRTPFNKACYAHWEFRRTISSKSFTSCRRPSSFIRGRSWD